MMLDYQEKGSVRTNMGMLDDQSVDKGRAGKRSFVEQSN